MPITALTAAPAPSSTPADHSSEQPRVAVTGWPRLLLGAGLAVLALEAIVFCLYGTTVYDEGGYLYEGWLTISRGWLPFRDFYAKIPPLIYYLYGLGQHLSGPSLLAGRIESAVFTFLGIALASRLARQVAGPWAAVAVLWLLATNPAALSNYLHAYAIAPTAFFIILAIYLLAQPPDRRGRLLIGGVATGAILLCRHDMLPLVLALWVYVLAWHPAALKQRLLAVGLGVGTFWVVLLPFLIAAPENVLSSLTQGKIGPQIVSPGGYGEATPVSLYSIAWHVMIFVRYYAAPMLLLLPALWWALKGRLGELGSSPCAAERRALTPVWVALGAAGVQWLSHVPAAVLTGGNVFYILDLYIFLPVAAGAAALYVAAAQQAPVALRRFVSASAVAIIVFSPILTGPGPHFQFSRARPTEIEQISRGGEFLRHNIRPGETVFTLDDPHQFLEAEIVMPASLTHELFGYRETPQTEEVRRLHFFNDEMIREWLGGQAQVVVMSAGAEQWLAHSGRYAGEKRLHDLIYGLIERNYTLVAEETGTLAGPLRIYRRR